MRGRQKKPNPKSIGRFDDTKLLQKTDQVLKEADHGIMQEEIESKGKPAIVLMNIAQKIIFRE